MAYTRRGFKGGARQTTLVGDINNSTLTIPGADLSTWAGLTSNGPGTATINLGQSDEETVTFSGISANSLAGVVRGAAGTTAQAHTSGATIDHTSSVTDLDEANAHIADTTLDHHTQYARTDMSRVLTGSVKATNADHYFGTYANGTGTGVTRAHVATSATQVTISAEGDGANRDLALVAKGGGHYWFLRSDGTLGVQVDNVGNLGAVGAGSFGTGALGAASSYVTMGTSDSVTAIVAAEHGTASTSSLVMAAKGSGDVYLRSGGSMYFQNVAGSTNYASVDSASGGAAFTGLAVVANGLGLSRVQFGAAGTGPGGSGRALYI